jgi:lipopolysaccharide/colanic/teichoic acid biosynthesis glycosyltransferase
MIKRAFDIFFSIFGLTIVSPIICLISILVLIKLGSPVFFRQTRSGLKGQAFEILKFRTMTDNRNVHGELLSDSSRLTQLGRFLRSTSLDELPELLNVLMGDMSLVGPRPLLVEYLPLYSPEQARRHEILPGITGWAQVNGRNALCWEEKFRLDVWYVDNQSFRLDLKILFLTVKKVLTRDGISASGEVTMPRFTGSQNDQGEK